MSGHSRNVRISAEDADEGMTAVAPEVRLSYFHSHFFLLLQYTTLCRLSRGSKHNTLHPGELDYTMVRYISGITVYIRSTTSPGAIQEGGQEGDACRQEIWWSVEGSKG